MCAIKTILSEEKSRKNPEINLDPDAVNGLSITEKLYSQ